MPLEPRQQSAFNTLRWLYSLNEADRQSGRTYVMALVFLDQAYELLQRARGGATSWVSVRDHHPTKEMDRYLLRSITNLVHEYGGNVDTNGYDRFRLIEVSPRLIRFILEMRGTPDPATRDYPNEPTRFPPLPIEEPVALADRLRDED